MKSSSTFFRICERSIPTMAVLFILFTCTVRAQRAEDTLYSDIGQACRDLSGDAVVMDFSAHPDDEDGATLAYYRLKYGVKTYSVLFTRGEGGQNEKGPELYEALGAIRSHETREAGAILGTQVVFLNFMDFGFSKTASEALQVWGGQTEVLRRAVYVIRKYKPDIIFTTHNTIDGHGHHQAVAITLIAAFDAAADPRMFPEQLNEPDVTLWQPKKLFCRIFGKPESTPDVSNPIDAILPGRNVSAIDVAIDALRKHRTQGLDRANLRGFPRGRSAYRLMRSNSIYEPDSTSFLGGMDFWRDPALMPLRQVKDLVASVRPVISGDSLLAMSAQAQHAIDSLLQLPGLTPLAVRLLHHWDSGVQRVVESVCGLTPRVTLHDAVLVPGETTTCSARIESRGGCAVANVTWRFDLPTGWHYTAEEGRLSITASTQAMPTVPAVTMQYHSLERHQDAVAYVAALVNRQPLHFEVPLSFDVAPFQTIDVSNPVVAWVPGRTSSRIRFDVAVRNWRPDGVKGVLTAKLPKGWKCEDTPFNITAEDSVQTLELFVIPPASVVPGDYTLEFETCDASAQASVHVMSVAVKNGTSVGIVASYDNTLESAVNVLGVPCALITDDQLATGDLSRFTTIIIDIRAYLVRDSLCAHNDRLLNFARRGGTLLVMYQREQEWKDSFAPYPFKITRKRVTREDARITVLDARHPLITQPNLIGPHDWDDWKQERAVYLPGNVAPEYRRLIACADPDEDQADTGYLVADTGLGAYVYTSYVWYRQLKEANPGAFRCFANMLGYSR